jgi:hypothetical protein
MVDQEYVVGLVIYGKRSAQNLAALQKRACELYQQMVINGGANLTSTAVPGQHITFSRPMSIQEEWTALQLALEQIAAKPAIIRTVYPLFW